MKTEGYLLLVIIIVLTNCSQPSSKEEVSDTAQIQTDTGVKVLDSIETNQIVESVASNEPPIEPSALAAPAFSFYAQTLSTDKRETEMVNKLSQLIQQSGKEKFVTMERSYIYDDPVVMGKINEIETWYYNANRELSAFSSTYKSERTTMSSLYLCGEGKVLALSSDNEFQDEGPRAYTSIRIVSSLCPHCGLNLSLEEESEQEGYQVTELGQSDLDQFSNDFFNKHNDMLKIFGEINTITKMEDRFSAFVLVNSDTIKYSIDANLITKFFKNGLNQN